VALDDRDYQTAVQNAQGQLDADLARRLSASITALRQPQLVQQTHASLPSDEAKVDLARANAERYRYLAGTGAGTVQDSQTSASALRQAQADLDGARAGFAAARRQAEVVNADYAAAQGVVASDEAKLVQAKLNLSYTRIYAPVDGVISQRSVQLGNNVSAGAVLMAVMPLNQLYIEANYREVALRHVRPGQHVRVHVDAYDVDLDGVVAALPPASGAIFAPVPPDNATGNFTKIVQRLPVKILISPGGPGFEPRLTESDSGLATQAAGEYGEALRTGRRDRRR
jgi:membrane fusion protein, multidrug efflux system